MCRLLKTLFVLALCVCVSCTVVAEEQKDIKDIGYEYADKLLASLAQRAEDYAPEILTLDNGVQVQRTPDGSDAMWHLNMAPISYNTYYLDADNRGCASCHDLGELSINAGGIPHVSIKNELGIEPTMQMCLLCHEASSVITVPDRFSGLMHQIHTGSAAFEAMNGNCWSCHYATDIGGTNEMKLWDEVKHQVLRGISYVSADQMTGTFSWNQEKTVDVDGVFTFPWMARRDEIERQGREESGIIPDPTVDGIYDEWTITINGEVGKETTMTIKEWIDAIGLETTKMTAQCIVNPTGGPLVANCEITGLSLEKMFAYCNPTEKANAFVEKAWPSWNAEESTGVSSSNLVDMKTIQNNGAYLVLEIGGEPLRYKHGYPVQVWIGGLDASYYTKEVREFTLCNVEGEMSYHTGVPLRYDGNPIINLPNVSIANLAEGQIIPVGEPHVFEGYAYGIGNNIKTVELSFDQGQTWISHEIEGDDMTRWIWWNYEWVPSVPGAYTIAVRATTENGDVTYAPVEILFNAEVM